MKGLELSKKFYLEHGKAAIEKEFSSLLPRLTIGLIGEGSECFGFDDELSTDHDFEPAFCIWISEADYDNYGFELERLYSKLPKEFLGYKRQLISNAGEKRHGVIVLEDFLSRFLGAPTLPESYLHWLHIPSHALASLTNGEIFHDGDKKLSEIRNSLKNGYPTDVKLKKLSAHCAMMAQSGLYNYERCIKRGENGAAQLSVFEFVKSAISVIYLLNDEYEPFYKWAYRKMRDLKTLSYLEHSLIALTELGNSEMEAIAKKESIKEICELFSKEFISQQLTKSTSVSIEAQAFAMQNEIKSPTIRNMHIMDGI